MNERGPVIALALDAMEASLVERLIEDGRMPNLASLMERGVYGEVRCRPDGFLSMVWPTFFTGQLLGAHGWYFNKLWSRHDQCLRYVDPSWLPIRPFWNEIDGSHRVALLDVPFSTLPDSDFNGLFLNGWQAHDDFGKLSVPEGLHDSLRRKFGKPTLKAEVFGPQNIRTLEKQRSEAIESLEQFARVVVDVLGQERWDLLTAVFGGAHRGTHYLWSLEEADVAGATPEQLRRLEGARDEIYEAADRALGIVLDAVPSDARVLVFALHGMGRNRGWAEHFGEIVAHLHVEGQGHAPKHGLIYRMKRTIPWKWIREVTTRLPSTVNHRLVPLWSRRMMDWSTTRYFALPLDLNGYLRVNVRGRDAGGIVEPGAEYEALLDRLTEEFMSLRDMRNDQPIVAAVDRVRELVGPEAPVLDDLPDLIVRWTDTYASGCPGIRTCYGEIQLDPNRPLPSGRSGNHTQGGWCVAAGPGIRKGRIDHPIDSLDLPVTLLDWMGTSVPERMEGTSLDEFLSEAGSKKASDQSSEGVSRVP